MREVQRKQGADKAAVAAGGAPAHEASSPKARSDLATLMERAERIRTQQRHTKNELHALHAPKAECCLFGANPPTSTAVPLSATVFSKDEAVDRRHEPLRRPASVNVVDVETDG